jgi:antitoxin CptB
VGYGDFGARQRLVPSAGSDYTNAMTDSAPTADENRRKRLKFRAWHRGMKEVDLILGPFADEHAARLSVQDLDDFELLLGVPDNDLYDWLCGRIPAPERYRTKLYEQIHDFSRRARGL